MQPPASRSAALTWRCWAVPQLEPTVQFNILYRLDARAMREDDFDHGEGGLRRFAEACGVLEKVTTIEASENSCSKARVSTTANRRPGASPLRFGNYLMHITAFVSLEDISDALPSYAEEVISVEMDADLKKAYSDLESDIRKALREHHGSRDPASEPTPSKRTGICPELACLKHGVQTSPCCRLSREFEDSISIRTTPAVRPECGPCRSPLVCPCRRRFP